MQFAVPALLAICTRYLALTYSQRLQRTLARPAILNGFGYWTGLDVTVEFRPAPSHSGFTFVRNDLLPERRIAARPENRIITPRRTTLQQNGGTVEMVEHLLAALAGMQVDNCEIVVSGPEMPAMDGSCKDAVEAIDAAGAIEQDAERDCVQVTDPIRVGDDDCWIEARPSTGAGLRVSYELDYGKGPIGRQVFASEIDPVRFRQLIAPARTFLLESAAIKLREQGISSRATFQDLLVFGPEGVIENTLRFEDECARHKTLDIIGDLGLVGFDISADIVAYRSGHRQNTELAAALLSRYKSVRQSRISA